MNICVVARKMLSKSEMEIVKAYNVLVGNGMTTPDDLREHLKKILGINICPGELIVRGSESEVVEIALYALHNRKQGDETYGQGAIYAVKDFPPGTVAIRVYTSC